MIFLSPTQSWPHDGPGPKVFRGAVFAHLMADTDAEVIAYAESIGMKRAWLQHPGTPKAHFDVTGAKLRKCLADPKVIKMDKVEYVKTLRRRRGDNVPADDAQPSPAADQSQAGVTDTQDPGK